jgi:hypothetical protein
MPDLQKIFRIHEVGKESQNDQAAIGLVNQKEAYKVNKDIKLCSLK